MEYNSTKLDQELKAAGIPIHGVSSNGVVSFKDEATKAQKDQAKTILAAHDPASLPISEPTPKEQYALLTKDADKVAFIARQLGLEE